MQTRRGFLGTVIGLWAGFDFFARTIAEPPQIIEASLEDYFMLFKDKISGETIRAPGIKEIESKYEKWNFVAHELNIKKSMILEKAILVDSKGKIIRESYFAANVTVCPGDKFKANYELVISGSGTDNFEKALQRYENEKN